MLRDVDNYFTRISEEYEKYECEELEFFREQCAGCGCKLAGKEGIIVLAEE